MQQSLLLSSERFASRNSGGCTGFDYLLTETAFEYTLVTVLYLYFVACCETVLFPADFINSLFSGNTMLTFVMLCSTVENAPV